MSASPIATTSGSDVEVTGRDVVHYDSHSIDEYTAKWDTSMGLGETALNDIRKVTEGASSA